VIDWATIEPGLATLVKNLTGLASCTHDDGADLFVDPVLGCVAKYTIYAVTPIGQQDEARFSAHDVDQPWGEPWGGTEQVLRENIAGVRELTYRLKIEAYDATAGRAAQQYTEKFRDALGFLSTHDALALLGITFLRTEAMGYIPARKDQRQRPFGFVDVRFGAVGRAQDPTSYSTIETVSTAHVPWV
jgi:hypothetical protein